MYFYPEKHGLPHAYKRPVMPQEGFILARLTFFSLRLAFQVQQTVRVHTQLLRYFSFITHVKVTYIIYFKDGTL